jgi:GxxExxY protein
MNNDNKSIEIFHKDEGFRINAGIFEVNRKLGSGFLESVYQEALELSFGRLGYPLNRKKPFIFFTLGSLSSSFTREILSILGTSS